MSIEIAFIRHGETAANAEHVWQGHGNAALSASQGTRFAEVMNDFTARLREMGPLGEGEGEGARNGELATALEGIARLVPYIKLVKLEIVGQPIAFELAK